MKHLRSPRDHRKLVADASDFMEASYFTIFFIALAYNEDKSEWEQSKKDAKTLLDRFVDTGTVPEYLEDFFIDVLIGRIAIFDDQGHIKTLKGDYHVA